MGSRRDFLLGGCVAAAALPQTEAATSARKVQLENRSLTFSLELREKTLPSLLAVQNRETGFNWCPAGRESAGPHFVAGGMTAGEWSVASWTSSKSETTIDYEARSGVTTNQRYRISAELPIVECAGEFRNSAAQTSGEVRSFGSARIPLRADLGPLQLHCVSRDTYAVQKIPFQDELSVDGGGWNSPKFCGLLILEAMEHKEFLFAIVQWERGWHYRLARSGKSLFLEVTFGDLSHALAAGERLNSPPVFVGVASGDAENAMRIAQRHLKSLAPKTHANWPWISYDIWGTESSGVEEAILAELEVAHELGVELFYIDASWYKGSSKKGTGDWGCGLGNYQEDREKFPNGLANISAKAHSRGMKFGLWVGPNIVDSRLVGGTIPKEWIASFEGKDRILTIKEWEATCHQVCLGCRDYVEFLKKTLAGLVRDFQLDWLKWDNSGIPGIPGRCDRSDHGHQRGDGSYQALLGQYEVYRHLHREFPDLVLEQCGYGSRLDYGLIDTIRANWLSDASFPSKHVRQNALAGSYIYPSSYNGAWIVKDPEIEKTTDPDTLDSIYRSRMMGLFGFGTLTGKLPERVSLYSKPVLEAAKRNIPVYKKYRHLLLEDVYHLFPATGSAEGWQAVQFAKPDSSESVVLCFRSSSPQSSARIPIRAVRAADRYRITNAKNGEVATLSGSQLLREGLIVNLPKLEMSEVFFLQKH